MKLQNLRAGLDVGLPIFVLIDPLNGEPVPVDGIDEQSSSDQLTSARACVWGRSIFAVGLDNRAISIGALRHPYLVELTGVDDPWLQETLYMAACERSSSQKKKSEAQAPGLAAHRIGGWIQTAQLPTALSSGLASAMLLHVQGRVPASYLRLADRRVLEWVRHIAGSERLCSALPPDLQWHYLAGNGGLDVIDTGPDGSVSPLMFTMDEWKRLEAGPVHHATAARWYGAGDNVDGECSNSQSIAISRWNLIEQAVVDARRVAENHPDRFRDIDDISAWAALALRYTEEDIERAIATVSRLSGSRANRGESMKSQYENIESALSDRRK